MSVQEQPQGTQDNETPTIHRQNQTIHRQNQTLAQDSLDAAFAEVFGSHTRKPRRRKAPLAVVPSGPPADEVVAWRDDLARQDKAPNTLDGYVKDLTHFRTWLEKTTGEPFCARAVTSGDVLSYKRHLRDDLKRAPATVNRHLAAIRSFMRWAIAEGHATQDPTAKVRQVPAVQQQPHGLEPLELRRLVRAVEQAQKPRDWLILCLGLHAGLRVSEAVSLRLGDVTMSERKGTLYVRRGKGDKDRAIPMNRDLREAVAEYLKVRPTTTDDRLLVSQTGRGLSDDAIQYLMRSYGQRAGIDDMHPHRLRHCFATTLARKGVPLPAIQRLLGHTSLLTTQRYMVATEADMNSAVAALETVD